jgi:hypothetical protein
MFKAAHADCGRELSHCFASPWSTPQTGQVAIHTSEIQELLETGRNLEPAFIEYANSRMASDLIARDPTG